MTSHRVAAPVLVLALLLGVSACTSSAPRHSTASSPAASSTGASAGSGSGVPVAPATLAATLQRGLAGATSAHLAITSTVTGQAITGSGSVTLAAGAITSADVTEQLPSGLGSVRLISVGGTDYADLPTTLGGSAAKPWVVLDPKSSNPAIAEIAAIAVPVLQVAAPSTLVAVTRAAGSVRDQGATTVGGTPATAYAVTVAPSALPSSVPSSIAGGSNPLALTVAVDGTGRPVQVAGTFRIAGEPVATRIGLSAYDQPVTITAPPASEIAR